MSTTALLIISDAMGRLNRLSPGETLNADDAAFGFTRLNLLVDELSASQQFLYLDVLTSVVQTGNITLGTGSWAAIALGDLIISATADNAPMSPITMQQYNELYSPSDTGAPRFWAQNGLGTVYLYPSPTGQTIKLQTRRGVAEFADQTTSYSMPPGYKNALGAALAVSLAPPLLGRLPPELVRSETKAMNGIKNYKPAIVDVFAFGSGSHWNILNGWV